MIGRVFAQPHDTIVNMRVNETDGEFDLYVIDPANSDNNSGVFLANSGNLPGRAGFAMADFDRDGYQDILYVSSKEAKVFTAKCTQDLFVDCTDPIIAGLKHGPTITPSSKGPYAGAPTAGDFDGDGVLEAVLPAHTSDGSIVIEVVSVCPDADSVVSGTACSQAFELVNFQTLDLNASLNLSNGLARPTVDIGAGNFDGAVNGDTGRIDDELVVALADSKNGKVTVTIYDYDTVSMAMVEGDSETFNIEHNSDNGAQVFVEGVQLDPDSQSYQAAFSYTKSADSVPHRGVVNVISFDNDLTMSVSSAVLANNEKTRIYGMAVGRFDPPNLPSGDIDFRNQIALLIDHDNSDTQVQIFSANPALGFALTEESRINISNDETYDTDSMQLSALAAGDLQGRSLVLGEPDKITISATQLDVAIGLPPMHVDYIAPVGRGDSANYETLFGSEPTAKLVLKALKNPGWYSFDLKVGKATIAKTDGCSSAKLLTNFTIEDGGPMPVHVVTQAEWICKGSYGSLKTK